MKNAVKAGLLVILLVSPPLSAIGDDSTSKFRAGFQTGGSVGLSSQFSQHSWGGHETRDYDLDVHFGGYLQYDFHRLMSLQFRVNYQHGSCAWTFYDPGMPEDSGKDLFSIFMVNLNAVFNAKKGKYWQFFFVAGGGLAVVHDLDGDDSGFNLGGGPGLRLFLSPDSPTALVFSAAYYPNWDTDFGGILQFSAGLEFGLPKHR